MSALNYSFALFYYFLTMCLGFFAYFIVLCCNNVQNIAFKLILFFLFMFILKITPAVYGNEGVHIFLSQVFLVICCVTVQRISNGFSSPVCNINKKKLFLRVIQVGQFVCILRNKAITLRAPEWLAAGPQGVSAFGGTGGEFSRQRGSNEGHVSATRPTLGAKGRDMSALMPTVF